MPPVKTGHVGELDCCRLEGFSGFRSLPLTRHFAPGPERLLH